MKTTNVITNPEKFRLALNASGKAWQKRIRLLKSIHTRSGRREQKVRRAIRRSVRAWLPVSWQAQRQYERRA